MSSKVLSEVDAFLAEEDSDDEGSSGTGASESAPLLQKSEPPQAPPQTSAADEEPIPERFAPKKKLISEGKLKRGQIISE
jgi:hypothetical protein